MTLIGLALEPLLDMRQLLPAESHVYLAAYALKETGKLLTFYAIKQ